MPRVYDKLLVLGCPLLLEQRLQMLDGALGLLDGTALH
jgi:hypothetical protein